MILEANVAVGRRLKPKILAGEGTGTELTIQKSVLQKLLQTILKFVYI